MFPMITIDPGADPLGVTIGKAIASQWLDPADEYKADLILRFDHAFDTYTEHALLKAMITFGSTHTQPMMERVIDDVVFTVVAAIGERQCTMLQEAMTKVGWNWERTNLRTTKFGQAAWAKEYWYTSFYRHIVLRKRGRG